jgi:mono/diheme cytochrome c family protein
MCGRQVDKDALDVGTWRETPSTQRSGALLAMLKKLTAAACLMTVTACATTGATTDAAASRTSPDLVAEGRTFASLKCASCHALDRSDSSANWDAPPMKRLLPRLEFKLLERDRPQDAIMSHGDMPPLHLSMVEKNALVAYLESLAGPPAE